MADGGPENVRQKMNIPELKQTDIKLACTRQMHLLTFDMNSYVSSESRQKLFTIVYTVHLLKHCLLINLRCLLAF